MYFDTHAHYDDEQFDGDRDAVLESLASAGVSLVVNASSNLSSSKASLNLAEKYPFVYAALGVHPEDASGMDDETLPELEKMLARPKAVAVGEIGLDYHYEISPRDVQKRRFREQLELARSTGLPAVIHERDATADALEIIRDFHDVRGVFHCFSGSWETAKIILDQGWYLSFTGVVTFKNARRAVEVIQNMPRDRMMIETDSPYLAPEPVRGRRNSSLFLPHIARKIAELTGMSLEETAVLTAENGKRFYCIP